MNTTKILVTTAFLLCANFAQANHHEGEHEGCKDMEKMDFSMKDLDTNKDGKISKNEYTAAGSPDAEKNFKHIDANSDGILDNKEQKDVEEVLKLMHGIKIKAPAATI